MLDLLKRRMPASARLIETPQVLARRYWTELAELVDQGEISAALADRVRDDMFEAGSTEAVPRLRDSIWRSYLAEARNADAPPPAPKLR